MLKRKPSIAAIGLATGAMALQPIWPTIQRFFQSLSSTSLQNLWATLYRLAVVEAQPAWPALQKVLENGYYHLTAVQSWNYLVISVAVVLEGPIATMLGGVWASAGRVNFAAILIVAILAGALADTFWYYLGYFGRTKVVERWGRLLHLDANTLSKVETVLFGDDAGRVLFTTKLANVLIIPTLIAAGMAQMGWRRVIRSTIVPQVVWSVGMSLIGFWAADSFARMSQQVEHLGWIVGGVLAILIVGRTVYRWRKARQAADAGK